MDDVSETTDTANDSERNARRRFKDAISRTKSKWKKEREPQQETKQEEFKLSEDVNDFLAAGRKAAATVTTRPVVDHSQSYNTSPRPSTSESFNSRGTSPRGVRIPKLDVSQSRWPNARAVDGDSRAHSGDHLHPNYERQHYERSQSLSSALAKKRSKSRGLSVSFVNSPPAIIGVGGDSAEAPPSEISRARQRSRSLSPYPEGPPSKQSSAENSRSPVRRKPVPSPTPSPEPKVELKAEREDSMFQPRPVRRVQTGFTEQVIQTPYVNKSLEMQLQDALRLGEELDLNHSYTDVQAHKSNTPPSQPAKAYNTTKPASLSNHLAGNQQSFTPVSQSPRSPNLQHSWETANKPPPPKVPNFYAELKRHSYGQNLDEQQPFVQHVQETAEKLQSKPKPNFLAQLRQNIAEVPEDVTISAQNMHQSPPGGWI